MSSNELAFAGQQLPAHLQQAQHDKTEFDDMGGAVIPRVKVRVTGIQVLEGEEVLAEVNAGGSIPLVIVGASPVSRSFYVGNYVQGESSMPDCRSYDGITPDANVPSPQASKCDVCPQNIKGSSKDAAGGKACRYRQNLAAFSPQYPDKLLRLPIAATSIFPKDDYDGHNAFRTYVAKLRNNKLQPFHVVTDVRQNSKSEQTHTVFKAIGYADADTYATAVKWRDDQATLDMIYGKFDNDVVATDASEEERKDAEAFEALHGKRPDHIQETVATAQPETKQTTAETKGGNSASATTETVLGYTPYEPQEVADAVTYWKGITVTRNLGNETVSVVIEIAAGQPLPDEEWVEVDAVDLQAYNKQVADYEASLAPPPPRRTRTRKTQEAPAETVVAQDTPQRSRRSTPVESTGDDAGQTQSTADSALADRIDSMWGDDADE